MRDERAIQRLTKTERKEHITRARGYATTIAERIDDGTPLEEWQQAFLRSVLKTMGAVDDPAGALRAWAANYEPVKSVGTYPKIRDVDTAYAYAMHRAKGNAHKTTLAELVKNYACGNSNASNPADRFEPTPVSWQGIWKAIEPLLPSVCADLGLDPETIAARRSPGRPRKSE